ncbi:MAG: hypothetical protein PHT98_09630, partial [Kiritimatiellae bacterium]|nr:hypothetical protein [Kiritimatiellia bacterium]
MLFVRLAYLFLITYYLLLITYSFFLITFSLMSAPPLIAPVVRSSLPLAARFSVYTLLIAALSIMLPAIVRQQGVA